MLDVKYHISELDGKLKSELGDVRNQIRELFDRTTSLDVRVTTLENAPLPEFQSYSSEIEELYGKLKQHEV
jgi:hypothetical protein